MTGAGPIRRLSSFDLMFLRLETPEWPCHFGGLTVLEGEALLDDEGRLRLQEITDHLERRLQLVPQLRRRLHVPGLLGGRPLWVDDPRFAVERHVHQTTIAAPGGDAELFDAAARVYMGVLDRRRPPWELWFFTGLREGRVAAMLKLHHAVADGMAAVTIMGSLFDLEPGAPDPPRVPLVAERTPSGRALRAENLAGKVDAVSRVLADLLRPGGASRAWTSVGRALRIARSYAGANPELQAPSTSLNRVVGAGRRIGIVRLDLAAVKDAAHAHSATVNDVVLDLWSGRTSGTVGIARRGDGPRADHERAGVASRRRRARTVDNRSGWVAFPLPTSEADPSRRLDEIARRTRKVKASQPPFAIAGFMAALAATPLARSFTTHQRTGNVVVTNVPGPPVPMYMFGARVVEILPIVELVGNLGLVLCAFSYAGLVSLVVTADAGGFPDLDVLVDGMERDWDALVTPRTAESMR